MNKRIIMIAALALAAVACGDDDGGGDDGVVLRPDSSITNPAFDGGLGLDATVAQDANVSGDGSTPKGAPGCFSATPTSSTQFLNACAEGYRLFDNKTRLQGFVEGQLPPLQ
ncbi:MAG TPA: hypothetical protein VFX59_12500 [Polyangiales bacterium]|nr:hypothetical protein [Polyangiales bacterium]